MQLSASYDLSLALQKCPHYLSPPVLSCPMLLSGWCLLSSQPLTREILSASSLGLCERLPFPPSCYSQKLLRASCPFSMLLPGYSFPTQTSCYPCCLRHFPGSPSPESRVQTLSCPAVPKSHSFQPDLPWACPELAQALVCCSHAFSRSQADTCEAAWESSGKTVSPR